jgi:flavorubredoxin
MKDNKNIDYERPVEIADGVFWVGFFDRQTGLHCNPYLIVDGNEAVVIDGGSRPDFATVMMKILQTGISPSQIKALIYQHYDPDLCGSLPNFEDMIKSKHLQIISAIENFMFIRHYAVRSPLYSIHEHDFKFSFSSGRTLEFITTPYSHSPGSFVTFDPTSKILFTSDLFGSLAMDWKLYLTLERHCIDCVDVEQCLQEKQNCPIRDIDNFHKSIMPSEKALKYALAKLSDIPFEMIAPQHGSILSDEKIIRYVFERLTSIQGIGIDGIIADNNKFDFSNFAMRLINK